MCTGRDALTVPARPCNVLPMDNTQTATMDDRIADFVNALNNGARNLSYTRPDAWSAMPHTKNARWQRIANVDENGRARSCHTWIDRTNGMVTYGAWKAPSKNRQGVPAYRYNLLDDDAFATMMVRVLTEPGFWLYEDEITRACH